MVGKYVVQDRNDATDRKAMGNIEAFAAGETKIKIDADGSARSETPQKEVRNGAVECRVATPGSKPTLQVKLRGVAGGGTPISSPPQNSSGHSRIVCIRYPQKI